MERKEEFKGAIVVVQKDVSALKAQVAGQKDDAPANACNSGTARIFVNEILLAVYPQSGGGIAPFDLKIPVGLVSEANHGSSLRNCFWDGRRKKTYPRYLEKVAWDKVNGIWKRLPSRVPVTSCSVRFTQAGLDRVKAILSRSAL